MTSKEWKTYKIGNFVAIKHGYAFKGEHIIPEDNGVVLVTPGNFAIGGGFQELKCKYYNGEYPQEYILKQNDLIVTMTDLSKDGDTLGYCAKIPDNQSKIYLHNQRIGLLEFKSDKIIKDFLYWYMRTKRYQRTVVGSCSGSVVKHTSPSRICEIEIHIPPLETQEKIACVLSSLDDKIELNNKINQNLEQQAQAIFKSWFVDFEPFGGKMPEDWEEKTLDEFCNIFTGKKNANQSDENGKNLFFTCGPTPLKINSFIHDGPAVIIAGNGAYTGRTRFYNGKFDLYQRTYACTLKKDVNVDYIYLLYIIIKSVLQEKIMGGTHGSAIPYIVMNDIAKFKLDYNKNVFDKLSKIIKSFVCIIQKNNNENEKLTQLRDTLLPKLMSGEIDVDRVNP